MQHSFHRENFDDPYRRQPNLMLDTETECKNLENFKGYLDSILQSGRMVSQNDIKHIFFEGSRGGAVLEGQNLLIMIEVYISEVKILQRIARYQDYGDLTHKNKHLGDLLVISSEIFRSLVAEGNNLKIAMEKCFIKNEKFNEVFFWIESLFKRMEDKMKEISVISSREALERMPRIAFGFLDLSSVLEERIASLENTALNPFQKRLPHQSEVRKPFISHHMQSTQRRDTPSFKENLINPLNKVEDHCRPPQAYNSDVELSPLIRKDDRKAFRSIENSPFDIQTVKIQTPNRIETLNKSDEKTRKKEGEVTSKRSFAMVTIREIIQYNNSDVPFDNITAVNCAQKIVEDFPSLNKSKEKLDTFTRFLKLLINNYPCTYRELASKNFPANMLSELLETTPIGLAAIETKYNNETIRKKYELALSAKGSCSNELPDKRTIKKKNKRNSGPKTNLMLKESLPNPLKQLQQPDIPRSSRVENLLKTFGIEESKLLNNSKVNEDLFWSKLIHSKSRRNKKFSPLSDQENGDNINGFMEQGERPSEIVKESSENDYDDERFSRSGNDDNTKLLSSSRKEDRQSHHASSRYHAKKRKDKTPILYDPDEENEPVQSDLMSNLADPRKPSRVDTTPPDCVIQIFDGMIQGLDHYCAPKIGLFTCSSLETVKLIPRIATKKDHCLRIKGSAAYPKIESYINKALNTIKKKEQHIISGWVESYIPMCQNVCERMASNLLFSNRVGIFKYADCVKMFFMHQKQFRPEWVQKFLFTKKRLQKVSYSTLYFLLMFQPHKYPSNLALLKKIKPEIIIPYKESDRTLIEEKASENNNEIKSPQEDAERDFNDQYSINISPISNSYSPSITQNTPKRLQKTPINNSQGAYLITKYVN